MVLAIAATLSALLSCGPRTRANPSAVVAAPRASSTSSAEDVPDAAPTQADAGPDAADASEAKVCLPPAGPFAAYAVGTKHAYVVKETVATHDPQDPYAYSEGIATFTVTTMECGGATTHIHGDWTFEGEASDIVGRPDSWLLEGPRIVNDGVVGQERTDSFDAALVAKSSVPICHTTTSKELYGRGLYRLCVDRHGLVSIRSENLAGPRTVELRRK